MITLGGEADWNQWSSIHSIRLCAGLNCWLISLVDSLDEDEDEESNFNPFPSATKRRNMRSVESTQRNNIFGSGIGAGGGDSSEGSPAEEVCLKHALNLAS